MQITLQCVQCKKRINLSEEMDDQRRNGTHSVAIVHMTTAKNDASLVSVNSLRVIF